MSNNEIEHDLLSESSLRGEIDKASKTYETYLKRSKVMMHNIFAIPVYNFTRKFYYFFFLI